MTESKKQELVKKHLNFTITHDSNMIERADFVVYTSTTVDDYNIYVATRDDQHINITEDVYYYNEDLPAGVLSEVAFWNEDLEYKRSEEMVVYFEEDLYDESDMGDFLIEWLGENIDEVIDNAEELELSADEVQYLKETY